MTPEEKIEMGSKLAAWFDKRKITAEDAVEIAAIFVWAVASGIKAQQGPEQRPH